MAYVTITLDRSTYSARGRVRQRMDRLRLTNPDLNGADVEIVCGDALSVDCADEILAAQLYRTVCDAIDEAE